MQKRGKISKKGISIMIGYVLLISFAVIIGGVIYKWMSTYTPKDLPECHDDVTIHVDVTCAGTELRVTIQNTGLFTFEGYYIKATNDSSHKVATIDLSENLWGEYGVESMGGVDAPIKPSGEETSNFNLSTLTSPIKSIEITPFQSERYDNRNIRISCEGAQVRKAIECPLSP